jgi:hypothetical protein
MRAHAREARQKTFFGGRGLDMTLPVVRQLDHAFDVEFYDRRVACSHSSRWAVRGEGWTVSHRGFQPLIFLGIARASWGLKTLFLIFGHGRPAYDL